MYKMETIQLGLRENRHQFALLVVINAFVGGMVGLERTLLPQLAELEFGIASKTAIFSFIIAFGITKAICNYFSGRLANAIGRKRLLVTGWLFALPAPLLIIYSSHWHWIVFANVLLGINQGLAWSMTVNMKIDLVGRHKRGLAVGINEFAGYVSIGLAAFLTGYIANRYGVRPFPFYLGIGFALTGLILSWLFVKDTRHHVSTESEGNDIPIFKKVFVHTSFTHRSLSGITQAGFVNNLNDGMMWGLLPLLLFSKGYSPTEVGILAAIYPTVWGLGQLLTGRLSDRYSKRKLLFRGMLIQGVAIIFLAYASGFFEFALIGIFLGLGTALVYPTFLNAIADYTHPSQRAESLGAFRFWRDMGYAAGALLTGVLADRFGLDISIIAVGALTLFSAWAVWLRVEEVGRSKNGQ